MSRTLTTPRRSASRCDRPPFHPAQDQPSFLPDLDLFGSEESTNAANFFKPGVKGRFHEDRLEDDHRLVDDTYPVMKVVDGELRQVDVPALNGLNARLRDDFIEDCQAGITRWNNEIFDRGIDFEIVLPHVAFNRRIGEFGEMAVTPEGGRSDIPPPCSSKTATTGFRGRMTRDTSRASCSPS